MNALERGDVPHRVPGMGRIRQAALQPVELAVACRCSEDVLTSVDVSAYSPDGVRWVCGVCGLDAGPVL